MVGTLILEVYIATSNMAILLLFLLVYDLETWLPLSGDPGLVDRKREYAIVNKFGKEEGYCISGIDRFCMTWKIY